MNIKPAAEVALRQSDPQTISDATQVLEVLSSSFQISWFREIRNRVWAAVLKPNSDLASHYSLNAEYYIIGNGHDNDFQRRTLLADPPPNLDEIRLDPRIRFVASGIPTMKAVCAAWAEETNRTVVPIDTNTLPNANSESNCRDYVYKELAIHLWRRDLFDDSEPVSEPGEFFGRESLVQELGSRILLGKPFSIFGLRKIGKTSLLRRMTNVFLGDTSKTVVPAFLSCNNARFKSGHWWDVLSAITDQWSRNLNQIAANLCTKERVDPKRLSAILQDRTKMLDHSAIAAAFERDVNTLILCGERISGLRGAEDIRLLAIFDEADHLYPHLSDPGHWKTDYFNLWNTIQAVKRSLNNPSRIVFAVCGINPSGVESGKLCDQPNPLFELSSIYLGQMESDEGRILLNGIGEKIGLNFEPEACSHIHALVGGHPGLLRKFGSRVHNNFINRGSAKVITKSDVIRVFKLKRRDFLAHVAWILGHLKGIAPDEFSLLSELAKDGHSTSILDWGDEEFREVFADHLQKFGLIDFDECNVPFITMQIVKDAVREPIASSFKEQKQELREMIEVFERTIRRRIGMDLQFDRKPSEAIDAIVSVISKESRNRPKGREELRELGEANGVPAILDSLNWEDYVLIIDKYYYEINWTGAVVEKSKRISLIRDTIKTLHLVRHNNDTELHKVTKEATYPVLFKGIRDLCDSMGA